VEHRVDRENQLSLVNWVSEYGMTCSPKYLFGLFGSLFFAAVVISSLLFTPLADKFGRKKVTLCGLAVVSIAQSLMLLSSSKEFSYFLVFMLGISTPMRVFVGYIYAMEFMPLNKTQIVTAVVLGNDGLVLVIASLWFVYVSQDWKTLWLMATILCYLTFFFVCTMPESPKFLVSMGRFEEAR